MCECEGPKTRVLTTMDLSDPLVQQWVKSQWDQLITTNDWLRNKNRLLADQISQLKNENTALQRMVKSE